MKRGILLALAVLIGAACSYAQDVIVTIDERHIDANIQEVSKSEIRYKDPTMLDGPTFVLNTEDVDSITFRNGKTQHFNSRRQAKIDIPNGVNYASADGMLQLIFDPANQMMYLFARKPIMYTSHNVRNIAVTTIRLDDKIFYVVFDLSNKYDGIALMQGQFSFYNNVTFRKYITKHQPESFSIEVSYESSHATHEMKRIDEPKEPVAEETSL